MPDWTEDILRQMDEEAEAYGFVMLNNAYLRGADVRLNAFRGPSEWLIVFQQIAVMEKRDFVNAVSAYGNRIGRPGTQQIIRLVEFPVSDDGLPDVSINIWDFTLELRGNIRHFAPTAQDYERAGVDVSGDVPDNVKVLRFLAAEIPDNLFLPEHQLLTICGRAAAELTHFIQLDEWHHPDVASGELPSQNDCLRSVARALSANDTSLYECPVAGFNTHWSNWEEIYGEL